MRVNFSVFVHLKMGMLTYGSKREDLVQKANKILAEYYGEVLSHDEQSEEDPLTPKYSPARVSRSFPDTGQGCTEGYFIGRSL